MHKTRSVICGVLSALAMPSLSTGAQAYTNSAITCVPYKALDNSLAAFDQYGVHNLSDIGVISVFCPTVGTGQAYASASVKAVVYDRTPATNDLCCVARVLDLSGEQIQTSTRCAPTYDTKPQTLSFDDINSVGTLEMDCSIPPHSANGYSNITSLSFVN